MEVGLYATNYNHALLTSHARESLINLSIKIFKVPTFLHTPKVAHNAQHAQHHQHADISFNKIASDPANPNHMSKLLYFYYAAVLGTPFETDNKSQTLPYIDGALVKHIK